MILNKNKIKQTKRKKREKKDHGSKWVWRSHTLGLKIKNQLHLPSSPPSTLHLNANVTWEVLGVGRCEVCVGGEWGLRGRLGWWWGRPRGALRIGSIPKYTVSIQMGFI